MSDFNRNEEMETKLAQFKKEDGSFNISAIAKAYGSDTTANNFFDIFGDDDAEEDGFEDTRPEEQLYAESFNEWLYDQQAVTSEKREVIGYTNPPADMYQPEPIYSDLVATSTTLPKRGDKIRVIEHTAYRYEFGSNYQTPIARTISEHETTITNVFVEKMEDEHFNIVEEIIIETNGGLLLKPEHIVVLS